MIHSLPSVALVAAFVATFSSGALAQYQARPVITALEPTAGPPGTRVKIKGKNFSPEYKIYYNGVELEPIVGSPTQIEVQIPKDAVQGRFTLKGPIHQVVSPQVFWVVQAKVAPVIKSIKPKSGPPGTVITIKGKNFSSKAHENVVTLGGAPLQIRSASPGRIDAVVSSGAKTGHLSVQVYNAGQTTSPQPFTVLAELKIEEISPSASPPGTRVTLKGSGFSPRKRGNDVRLGGKPLEVIKASASELVVQIPKKGVDSGRFSVKVKGLGSYEHPKIFPLVFPPTIEGFEPESGPIGTEVTLKGKNLGRDKSKVQVSIGGRPCPVKSVSGNAIRVTVPQGAVTAPFKIAVPEMGDSQSKEPFEVWAPLAVTRMEPVWGLPGTQVRLWGTGFRADPADHTLLIGSQKVKIKKVENGVLVFEIPEEAPDGKVALSLEVKERGAAQVAIPLTVVHSPKITEVTPMRGYPGMTVNVQGRYFATKINHIRVLLGGQVVPVSAVTPTSLSFVIPGGAQSGKITVQTKRRGSDNTDKDFEIYVPVRVTNVLPSMGYAGQAITLFGNGFESKAKRNKVTLAGKKVKVVEASVNRLKVVVPKGATSGRFRVEVSNRGFSESPQQFAVVEKLAVKNFKPAKGVPGTYVSIKGKGFDTKGLRGYIGRTPIGVRVDSPTQVTIAIPPNGTTGKFVFTAPGAGRAETNKTFEVLTPVTVTGFAPAYGEEGTKVSIYGTGFDLKPGRTKVVFGNKPLKIEPGSSESMLVVTIPKGAMDAPFKVSVKGMGEKESENVFSLVESKPAAAKSKTAAASAPVKQQPAPAPPEKPAPQPAAKKSNKPQPPTMDELMGIDGSKQADIASFEPTQGPVGETVMIQGKNFGEDASAVKAWVGQTPAKVIGCVPDMIMIEVPDGVKRGKIRLKIGKQPRITSKKHFLVE